MKTIARAAALIFTTAGAFAQMGTTGTTNAGPNGVTGAAPTKDVGTNPAVANTPNSATTSSSMEMQNQKKDNAAGVPTTTHSNTK